MRTKIYFTIRKQKSAWEQTQPKDFKVVSTTDLLASRKEIEKEYPGYAVTNIEIY